jgi:hypothetical protein
MPLTNLERTKLVSAIKHEVIKLCQHQYRDKLKDDNALRQQAIDNDLAMIHEHLWSINSHTKVDAECLNNTR